MRILIWPSGYPPSLGGVEAMAEGLARSLHERGHEVAILAPDAACDGLESVESGVRVWRLPLQRALAGRDPFGVLLVRRRVSSIWQTFAPDLVHVNAFHPGLFFFLDAPRTAAATVFTIHAFPPLRLDAETVPGRVLREVDWVTACASTLLFRARRAAPEITERSSAIPNARPPGRAAVAPPPSPPTAVCVGRLVRAKGFDRALDAFANVAASSPDARLRLVGDGPERDALEDRIDALGLRGRVEFAGAVAPHEVAKWLDAAHVVVIPSRGEEGMPLVALEAAQRARPVVGFAVDGVPEAVVHGGTGLLAPADDETAFAAALGALLCDLPRAAALGRAARERAEREFGWDTHVDRYEQLYERIVTRSGT